MSQFSLIDQDMEPCAIMNVVSKPDEEGGVYYDYEEGAEFPASINKDTSTVAKIAGAQGVTALYSVYTTKAVKLSFPAIIKRKNDSTYLRITTKEGEQTPESAALDLRKVDAEDWTLKGGNA